MKKLHAAQLILAFSLGAILVLAFNLEPQPLPEEHSSHHHELYEVPEGSAVPSLDLSFSEDIKGGWNLHLLTENFKFSPENASIDAVVGEGHSHLFINGVKITRVYGDWLYIPVDWLEEGENEVHVTLNTNDHLDYAVNGEPIEASVTIIK